MGAHLLAVIFNRININCSTNSKPINLIVQFLCRQVNYKSGLNRLFFDLIMLEWGSVIETYNTSTFSKHLVKKILEFLDDETTLYYDEIVG